MSHEILSSGEFVLLNGEMAERDSLFIEWLDYGDNFYDLHICHKSTGDLFGSLAWCGIPGLLKTKQLLKSIQGASGIEEVRKKAVKEEY